MEIKISRNGDNVYLVELSGVLDLYSAEQLKGLIMKMLAAKVERFILGLGGITAVNSSGIGALIYVSSTLKKLKCPLAIIVPGGPVLEALELTRLTGYFTVAGSLEEALSFLNENKRT